MMNNLTFTDLMAFSVSDPPMIFFLRVVTVCFVLYILVILFKSYRKNTLTDIENIKDMYIMGWNNSLLKYVFSLCFNFLLSTGVLFVFIYIVALMIKEDVFFMEQKILALIISVSVSFLLMIYKAKINKQ
ncbi:MAG: hypothetical protein KZQ69_14880 [gamma proteobacterium symbiont of Bathyaustriella thionipta]|nr:hypothetical protein [gamma proteobacterium symbiont of Bathyaustriella thionipta]